MGAQALVLTGFGINCEQDTAQAILKAGGKADIYHVNDVLSKPKLLEDYNMLVFPGGFSFGDDLGSGKVLANKISLKLKDNLLDFIKRDTLTLGICNGFQALVKMGLLPYPDFEQRVTLTFNSQGHFEDRWVILKVNKDSPSIVTRGLDYVMLPVRHGEGRFLARDETVMKDILSKNLYAAQYVNERGELAGYPANPNGSAHNIAALCDPTGRVFGMMPHPEAFIEITQHPYWTNGVVKEAQGLKFWKNAVEYLADK